MLRLRTKDLASRGPRNLRSRGTLPLQKKKPYMWYAAVPYVSLARWMLEQLGPALGAAAVIVLVEVVGLGVQLLRNHELY